MTEAQPKDKAKAKKVAAVGSCDTCLYGAAGMLPAGADGNPREGNHVDCRRYPTLVQKHAKDWCGEFKGLV